jgi:hypothetical protein
MNKHKYLLLVEINALLISVSTGRETPMTEVPFAQPAQVGVCNLCTYEVLGLAL